MTQRDMNNLDHQRKLVAILRVLEKEARPLGSSELSRKLAELGIDLGERMIRNYLLQCDKEGLTKNLGRRGRMITERGSKELEVAVIFDKVGFVNSRIDELAYRMDFDDVGRSGTVILNISTVKTFHVKQTLDEFVRVMNLRLGMGRFFQLGYPGQSIQINKIPKQHVALGTICSVTLNGILLRHGISMASRFGGLLEMKDNIPVRFSQIINYDGTTIDPIEIFIKGKMTSVQKVVQTGTGSIGASFREIPAASLDDAVNIIENLQRIGLGGVLMVGKPNRPLLDIPVGMGRVGLIVAAGLNPVAALEENGLVTTSRALSSLCNFSQLQPIESISTERV